MNVLTISKQLIKISEDFSSTVKATLSAQSNPKTDTTEIKPVKEDTKKKRSPFYQVENPVDVLYHRGLSVN